MKISGHTLVYALLGHPVSHSQSPKMHNTWFRQVGLDAVYVALDVHPDDASEIAQSIRILGLAGVNLTVPFKRAVLSDLDLCDVSVREAGAANVVVNRNGLLIGYNTDGEGFLRSFREEIGPIPSGRAIILGAGGAGRAIAAALARSGISEVIFLNRTVQRAEEAAADLADSYPSVSFGSDGLHTTRFAHYAPQCGLVINCAAKGAQEAITDFDASLLPDDAVWSDINYWMAEPPQRQACMSRGLRFQSGMGMLVHQGALAFERFTGESVDPALIRGHLI